MRLPPRAVSGTDVDTQHFRLIYGASFKRHQISEADTRIPLRSLHLNHWPALFRGHVAQTS
jgi:hypothetical protein